MLEIMLDYPVCKFLEEVQTANALKEILIVEAPPLRLLSASSIPALDLAQILKFKLKLVLKQLIAIEKDQCQLADIMDLLNALTL